MVWLWKTRGKASPAILSLSSNTRSIAEVDIPDITQGGVRLSSIDNNSSERLYFSETFVAKNMHMCFIRIPLFFGYLEIYVAIIFS